MRSKKIKTISFCVSLVLVLLHIFFRNNPGESSKKFALNRDQYGIPEIVIYPVATNYERKDWHDWKFIKYELGRQGPGEQGEPVVLTDPEEVELNQELFKNEGLYALVSDKISVNRSVPDSRRPVCKTIQHFKSLPSTSIIVIFHNEHLSLLFRTIHALWNRTPHELLHEILLVNDASTKEELYEPLAKYVRENFDDRVKIVNLNERKGLIVTRMEGARRATGEVLVFLDSHMEANVNWLPPLLEPIAIEPKTCTVPIIDNFEYDTFEYSSSGWDGSRGIFDWNFIFRWLPRRPEDMIHPEKPAPLPVLLGCAFAIRKDYFFDLGGYDEQLMIWNGENYELSFKLWLCGGQMLEVPCSRVAHVFRMHNKYRSKQGIDFEAHNFKRIAEVWLDDYKQYLYRGEPERYARVDAGDLTREKQIKTNLNCKPFQYFLEYIMPDMLERYPIDSPGVFAKGAIQSEADTKLCMETLDGADWEASLVLSDCSNDLTRPPHSLDFVFTWHRQIMQNDKYETCMDAGKAKMIYCQYNFGKQFWFYNLTTHQIVNPPSGNCLTASVRARSLQMEKCKDEEISQKFKFGYTNTSALKSWKTFGVKLPKKMILV